MSYLFQVTLGPVQSFIMGARRTRDLKFTSSFLSRLARSAAFTIARHCGETSLIFPTIPLMSDVPTDVPNKVLAYITAECAPVTLAGLIKDGIDTELNRIKDSVFQKIPRGTFRRAEAELQIAGLVEYLWAAVEHDEKHNRYALSRQCLEALLAARKNTRDFASVTWGSEQPKSSIDGQLECVIAKDAYPRLSTTKVLDDTLRPGVEQQVRNLRDVFGAGPHEKLSGVDLLKRLGPIEEGEYSFPSTSHMAALPFLCGLKNLPDAQRTRAEEHLKTYTDALLGIQAVIPSFALDTLPRAYQHRTFGDRVVSLGEYDGSLLYPERFPDTVGDTRLFQLARQHFQQATRLLEDSLQELALRPGPYYTLLVADGDCMGEVVDALAQREDGMQQHRKLSLALIAFEKEVRQIIERHISVRIYSGGDDVLALLPLHEAVPCASDLAAAFRSALDPFASAIGRVPSLSVGLAIVHHLHPLGDALKIARNAEQRAKGGQKNALAITVHKRGGPPCEIGGQWSRFDARLQCQIELCQSGILPSGMAYELEEVVLRLEAGLPGSGARGEPRKAGLEAELSAPHVRYAALRIFQRKLGEAGRQGGRQREAILALYALKRMIGLIGTDEASQTPDEALQALDEGRENRPLPEDVREQVRAFDRLDPVSVTDLAAELIVARFLADAYVLASAGRNTGG
ncbi:MAG TPA: type III-B CRISPR-associated protein Cas10/Cmr2 [Ktedonobacteraceae bacterium]|jgi:CRISPR-associated protein Cmr2